MQFQIMKFSIIPKIVTTIPILILIPVTVEPALGSR